MAEFRDGNGFSRGKAERAKLNLYKTNHIDITRSIGLLKLFQSA